MTWWVKRQQQLEAGEIRIPPVIFYPWQYKRWFPLAEGTELKKHIPRAHPSHSTSKGCLRKDLHEREPAAFMSTHESKRKAKPQHQSNLGQRNWFVVFKSEPLSAKLLQKTVGSLKISFYCRKFQLYKILSDFQEQANSSSFLLLPPNLCCLKEAPSESLQYEGKQNFKNNSLLSCQC